MHASIDPCLMLLISMLCHRQAIFESKGDKLTFCWMRDSNQGLCNRISSKLNARWQTDRAIEDHAKNLNSIAHPYDQRAFSPLDPTADWLSHLALAICMFVVVNIDALAQASDFRIERRQAGADWMPADKPTELSRIKLKQYFLVFAHATSWSAYCLHPLRHQSGGDKGMVSVWACMRPSTVSKHNLEK